MYQVAGMHDGFGMNREYLFHTMNSQFQRCVAPKTGSQVAPCAG